MTDISATPRANRYRLRTFGTLVLAGAQDDTLLGAHGHQHGRLALLAVLAAAGDEGRSRDQLLLLFWPDATQSRARHSLDQLLYAMRSSIDEDLFAGVSPVRLNPAVVSSDVREFQGALERGDLEGAIAQYRGPFLDGFHLSDTPEFERWLETERAHLERSYTGALQRLAQSAAASSDHAAAVRWWRKLTDVDPVSNTNAVGLIRALMSAGDLGAALQHAERYERVVSQELGTNAGPEVAKLVAEVRERTKSRRIAVMKSPPPPPPPPRLAPHVAPAPYDATEPPAQPQPQSVSRRRSVSYAVGGGAALGIVMIAAIAWLAIARRPTAPPPPVAAERSIAVLPFANVSGDQHDAALVDGLSQELIAVLAKIPNLQVVARTSAFAFRNSNAGARRIADSLGVRYLLEGGVQRAGSRLHVQVRLVDARDGSTRWSETYDRKLKDIFSVQSDIAGSVARQLDLRLGISTLARIKRGSTSNIAAYELYLRGNDPALTRSDSLARAGSEYFRQAIALDPGYAAAYAGLARLQLRIGSGDDRELSRTDRLAIAEEAARKAVALDDSLGEAHAALSFVETSNYHLASAEREMLRAASLEPTNARIREWLIQLLIFTERPGEALLEARRALELDPLSPTVNAELAHALLANDRCGEALPLLAKLQSLRPPLLRARDIAAQCYARKRMWPEAIAEVQPISEVGGPRAQALLGYLLGRAGRTNEARRTLATLLERSRRINGGAFDVAMLYAGLGENDQAFLWLDRALEDRSLELDHLETVVTSLPRGPRLDNLRRRLGLRSDSAARAGAGTPTPPELSSTKNQ